MNIISYSQSLNSNGNPQVYKDPNNDVFTIAVGAVVNIVYDISDEYTDVGTLVSIGFSPSLPAGLTASLNEALGHLTISGTTSAVDTLSSHTITINQNDGGPVATVITDTLGLEVLEPNFTTPTQTACTYCLGFEPIDNDTTSQNAGIASRGTIAYYSVVDEVETLLGTGTYNGLFTHCFCAAATDLEIKTVLTIRQIPNCGGTSPIVFQATSTPNSLVTIVEYQPLLVPITFGDCCQVIDKEITVYPTEINLYRVSPHTTCATSETGLTITWTKDGETLQTDTYTIAQVVAQYATPTALTSAYTPTELGAYVVTMEASNCCATTTETITFNICNDWTVEKGDCNNIVITNSSTSAITYTVKELGENGFTVVDISGELENISLSAGASVTIDLVTDNLYTVTIENDEYVLLLDCNIKLCEKELLLDFLCGTEGTCNVAELNSRQLKYIRFNSLRSQLYGKWNEYYQTQSIYTVLNLNDENDDLLHLKDIIIKLQKVCDSCGISTNCNTCKRTIKLTENCGCN